MSSLVKVTTDSGLEVTSWDALNLRDQFDDPLGEFTLELSPTPAQLKTFKDAFGKGVVARLTIDEAPQAVFLIESMDVSISAERGVMMSITGKTPLCVPYEGGVDPRLSLSAKRDTSALDYVRKVLKPYGLDTIADDERAALDVMTGRSRNRERGPRVIANRLQWRDAQPNENESAYRFIARIITRLGVCLRMGPTGDVLVTAPHYEQPTEYTLVSDSAGRLQGNRFIGGIQISETNRDQFSEITVRGMALENRKKRRTTTPSATVSAAIHNPLRPAYMAEGRASYKPLFLKDKNARDVSRCRSVARLAHGMRARDAMQVRGRVQGFRSREGALWTVDTLVRVVVPEYGLDEEMWIYERTFRLDARDGETTELTLLPKGALQLGEIPA